MIVSDTPEPEPTPETVQIIADLAVREYADENDHTKSLDGKIGPLMGVTGAIMVGVAGILARAPEAIPSFWAGFYFAGICLVLGLLAGAEVFFLRALWIRNYARPGLNNWATLDSLASDSTRVKVELIGTYRDAVNANAERNDNKASNCSVGLVLVTVGVTFLAVLLAVASTVAAAS